MDGTFDVEAPPLDHRTAERRHLRFFVPCLMTETSHTGRRRDAQRNRERLLDAASTAFARGDPVSLEAIAEHAGLGIGTLYRHFPSREALVEAVYRSEVQRLVESAEELLGERAPEVALRAWMDRFASWVATKRGMVDTLRVLTSSGTIERSEVRDHLTEMVQRFLDAGIASKTLRDDVRARDVLASITGIFLASGNDQQAQTARMLDLLMDGLRPQPDR
jgi:AcrR family transcriptional regulator